MSDSPKTSAGQRGVYVTGFIAAGGILGIVTSMTLFLLLVAGSWSGPVPSMGYFVVDYMIPVALSPLIFWLALSFLAVMLKAAERFCSATIISAVPVLLGITFGIVTIASIIYEGVAIHYHLGRTQPNSAGSPRSSAPQ